MFDFLRFCRTHGVPISESGHHHCHQGWLQTHCPFCTDGRSGWHLGFSLERGNLHCWRCGSHRLWDAVGQLLHTSDRAIIGQAWAQFSTDRQYKSPQPITRHKTLKPPPGTAAMKSPHKKYLASRQFDPDRLETEWGLLGTGISPGGWAWRVILPVQDVSGNTVAYQGRTIQPDVNPRYKMSDNQDILIEPEQLIYGLGKASKSVVVVEGPTDVWRLGAGAVALFGIGWKPEQAIQLTKFPHRFIMFDPEPEAQRQAEKLAEWLAPFPGATEIIEDLSSDPGDLPQEDADGMMKELLGV